MNFELTIEWAVGLLALGITIPLALKIALSIKKTVSKTKNGDVLAQNADITAETEASPITAIAGRDAFESNFAKFKEPDLLLLEPIIDKIIDYRKTFADLEVPAQSLIKRLILWYKL